MVVMSLEKYAQLTDDIELRLDEADCAAAASDVRYTHEEVFSRLRVGRDKMPTERINPFPTIRKIIE